MAMTVLTAGWQTQAAATQAHTREIDRAIAEEMRAQAAQSTHGQLAQLASTVYESRRQQCAAIRASQPGVPSTDEPDEPAGTLSPFSAAAAEAIYAQRRQAMV